MIFGVVRPKDPSSILPVDSIDTNEIYHPVPLYMIIVTRCLSPQLQTSIYFLRKEQPSVKRAFSPVGWQLGKSVSISAILYDIIRYPIQNLRASLANDNGVCVREHGGDCEASGALDVHEERSGSGNEGLELVLAGLTVMEGQWETMIRGVC